MMTAKQNRWWRSLTFSQRAGEATLPEALEAGKLSTRFRNAVWFHVGSSMKEKILRISEHEFMFIEDYTGKFWEFFWLSYCLDILEIPHDMPEHQPQEAYARVRTIILDGKTHEVLTFIEYMFRISNIPHALRDSIENSFQFVPYGVDRSGEPVCIFPTTSEEMETSVKRALAKINKSKLTGVKTHLHNASQELNGGNYAASIRNSIDAVASAARKIDPDAAKDLGPALNSLERKGIIKHRALTVAFKKLYGYTSDEQGIRKPLIENESADVGFDEAIFMYGACVSFVDYLVSKQKQFRESGVS